MSFPTNWDVDKYYDPFEFKEHWILRKVFMLKHKKKFPEDRLAGLAKMFYNMEFLGCIYNPELMKLVQNLAEQVDTIVQYRNKKKQKLQRTFVKASDAVKRHIEKTPATGPSKMQYVNFVAAKDNSDDEDEAEPENKRLKIDPYIERPELQKYAEQIKNPQKHTKNEAEPAFVHIGHNYLTKNQFMPEGQESQPKTVQQPQPQQYRQPPPLPQKPPPGTLSKTQQKKQATKQMKERNQKRDKYKLRFDLKPEDRALLNKVKSQNGFLSKLVLYDTQVHKSPFGQLDFSASKANINMKIVKDETNEKYLMYMDEEFITEIPFPEESPIRRKQPTGHRKLKIPEDARNAISEKAFEYLRKYCFTLIDHDNRNVQQQISKDNFVNGNIPKQQIQLSMDGIGAKMMKQMGWGGKGLGILLGRHKIEKILGLKHPNLKTNMGKDATGIIEPIQASIRVYRRGFGQGSDQAFNKSVWSYFEQYLTTGETKRLIFSKDFSKEDRAKVHTIAGQFGLLKSKSYGKDDNRHITVERKLSGWDIVEQVLAHGGSNDSYTLIKPTDI